MIENCRPVLSPDIMPLSIERRRVVDEKQHFKQLAIADDGGIEHDTDCFCMTGPAAAYSVIRWMIYLTTDVTGLDRHHPLHLVIDRFKTPEATAGYGCNADALLYLR